LMPAAYERAVCEQGDFVQVEASLLLLDCSCVAEGNAAP
jgi:hypothetical protein